MAWGYCENPALDLLIGLLPGMGILDGINAIQAGSYGLGIAFILSEIPIAKPLKLLKLGKLSKKPVRVNLGGEGEVPGAINQQGPWIRDDSWRSSETGKTLRELQKDGHTFVISDNKSLPFKGNSVDEVITNSVPIDKDTFLGPGVQSSEINRILKPGGTWTHNGQIVK